MAKFIFEGTATIERKFKIEVISQEYEGAREFAEQLLEDVDNSFYYQMGDDVVEIDFDQYEEIPVTSSRNESRD